MDREYVAYMAGIDETRVMLQNLRRSQVLNRDVWLKDLDVLEPKVREVTLEQFKQWPRLNNMLQEYGQLSRLIRDAWDPRIDMADCLAGVLYTLRCRNSNCGIWVPKKCGFDIARTKFDYSRLDIEYHCDTGPICGTARPYMAIEPVPTFMDDEAKLEYLVDWKNKLNNNKEVNG